MRFVIFLSCFLGFATSASADGTGFSIDNSVTSNSRIQLSVDLDSDVNHLLVQSFYLDGPQSNPPPEVDYIAVHNSVFQGNIYLRQGAGHYNLMVFICKLGPGQTCEFGAQYKVDNTDSSSHVFDLPAPEIQSDDPLILGLAIRITAGLKDPLAKARAIHNWIIANKSYDVRDYFSGAYQSMSWDAVTMLGRQSAVCEGYANLNAALLRAVGIPAKVVTGTANPQPNGQEIPITGAGSCNHAWNEVFIDQTWMLEDPTWDAGYIDASTHQYVARPDNTYFLPDPEVFNMTHRKCADQAL